MSCCIEINYVILMCIINMYLYYVVKLRNFIGASLYGKKNIFK